MHHIELGKAAHWPQKRKDTTMGKKVVLAVFGGIALLGLVMSIVGWALGGEVGSLQVEEGEMVYHTSQKSMNVGPAPYWMGNGFQVMNLNWRDGWRSFWEDVTTHREIAEYIAEGTASAWDGVSDDTNFMGKTGETITVEGPEQVVNIPASVEQMNLQIELGYLVIKQGDALGLTVRGPLAYESDVDGSTWNFTSDTDEEHNISTRNINGETHYFRGNKDLTTVFILTLPSAMPELEASMNLGQMTVKDIQTESLDLRMDVGSMLVNNVVADEANINTSVGAVSAQSIRANTCYLHTEVGSIEFAGSVSDYLDINSEVGSVNALLERPAGGYYATAEADIGTISVDGQNTRPGSSREFGNEENYTLEMNLISGVGSIDVQFASVTEAVASGAAAPAAPEAPKAPKAPEAPALPNPPATAEAA